MNALTIMFEGYCLTFSGLEDDAAPLEVAVRCVRCERVVGRRLYPVTGTAADFMQLVARARAEAAADALRGLAHSCGERN